jgi:hypothetical protein
VRLPLKIVGSLIGGFVLVTQRKRIAPLLMHVLTKATGTWVGSPRG